MITLSTMIFNSCHQSPPQKNLSMNLPPSSISKGGSQKRYLRRKRVIWLIFSSHAMIAENNGLDDLSYTQGDVMVCVCMSGTRDQVKPTVLIMRQGVLPLHSDTQNTWNSKYIKPDAQV